MHVTSPAPTRRLAVGSLLLAAACVLALASGCAGDEVTSTDGTVSTVSTETANVDDTARGDTAVDDTAVDDRAVGGTTVELAASTAGAANSAIGGPDACLQGTWMADASLIQAFVDSLDSPLRIEVGPTSVWNLTFEDDQVTGSNAVTLSMRIDGSMLSVSGATQLAGTFDAGDGVLDAELTTNVTEYSEWSTEIDGQPVALRSAPATPPRVGPELAGASYTCTADLLTVSAAGGIGPAQYHRAK
jgi:hypothetical protein